MSRDDWYRNSTWNAEIEAAFFAKLHRARDKAGYLRIQACILAEIKPDVALRLLEQYFELGDHFDWAQAHVDRASAYLTLGDVAAAVEAFEAALARETVRPNMRTYAYLELPRVIATHRLADRYGQALDILDLNRTRLTFPQDRYLWNGARALILKDSGRASEAGPFAEAALAAAREAHSGFRYHPTVGLVRTIDNEFGDRPQAISRPLN